LYGSIDKIESSLKDTSITQVATVINLRQISKNTNIKETNSAIGTKIKKLLSESKDIEIVSAILFDEYKKANKDVFYPLIAGLFNLVGFACHATRAGINYERWDAIATDPQQSIPIEIKSPTEELFISIKAVRQALENKVVLLSRKSYITDWNTATLAVGYHPPNDRAEVSRLIMDIKEAFGIRIGIIDFLSLIKMSIAALSGSQTDFINEVRQMEGIINVENI
jgi:hypothetical protein